MARRWHGRGPRGSARSLLTLLAILIGLLGVTPSVASASSPTVVADSSELSRSMANVSQDSNLLPAGRLQDLSLTLNLAFNAPITEFIRRANSRELRYGIDWTTDGCSAPPPLFEPFRSKPENRFDFRNACWRHDFAYRNFKALGVMNEDLRRRADDKFQHDMDAVCAEVSNQGHRNRCYEWSYTYYSAVRVCGAAPNNNCLAHVFGNLRFRR